MEPDDAIAAEEATDAAAAAATKEFRCITPRKSPCLSGCLLGRILREPVSRGDAGQWLICQL